MTKVKDIANEIEKLAPRFLKESYDNVGLMVGDKEREIKKILLALDCTKEVIEEAIDIKCDFIITHHPLLFKKPKSIVKGDLVGEKIISLIKNDISLYSCHTNLDSAKNGINDMIVKHLGFQSEKIIEPSNIEGHKDAGIGRIVELSNEISIDSIVNTIREKLQIKHMRIAKGNEYARKIAIINGSGQDLFYEAKALGADCIISGDTTYHFASDFKEMGITIIDPGHFATEWIVFLKTLEYLKNTFKDLEFFEAKACKDPYDFI